MQPLQVASINAKAFRGRMVKKTPCSMEEARRARQGGYVYLNNGIQSKLLIPCEDRLLLYGGEHSRVSDAVDNIAVAAQCHSIPCCRLDTKHFIRVIRGRRSQEHFSQPQDFSRDVSLPGQCHLCHTDGLSTASFGLEKLAAALGGGVNHPARETAR